MMMKHTIRNIFAAALFSAFTPTLVDAQQDEQLTSLYEQASETSGLVVQYEQDVRAIGYFSGPMSSGGYGRWGMRVLNSPEQRTRLHQLDKDYLGKLADLDFEAMSIHGQVDYVLLKRKIDAHIEELEAEGEQYARMAPYLPFAEAIYSFEAKRRRGTSVEGETIAQQLDDALDALSEAKATVETQEAIPQNDANFLADAVSALKSRLKSAFDFYNGYDPMFTWWVPAPYQALDTALASYAKLIADKTDAKPLDDGSDIGGKPIGREAFARELRDNMIPYPREELLKLADQEFAWCEAELLKASREMGFGDDWKAAQEKVKNSYVAAGKQPELIIKLYKDANDFIKTNDLVTMPPLAEETWGMVMMT